MVQLKKCQKERSKLKNEFYRVALTGYRNQRLYYKNKRIIKMFIDKFNNKTAFSSTGDDFPYIIADGVSIVSANNISHFLKFYSCKIEIQKSELTHPSKQENFAQNFFRNRGAINCPKCGDTNVRNRQVSSGLLGSFLGDLTIRYHCVDCGYVWDIYY